MSTPKRLTFPIDLTQKTLIDLIEDCIHVNETDFENHEYNLARFLKEQESGKRSEAYLKKFRFNLENTEIRYDLYSKLIQKLQSPHNLIILHALGHAKAEVEYLNLTLDRNSEKYGFIYQVDKGIGTVTHLTN